MVSCEIWKEHAQVSFSKTIKIAQVRVQFEVFEKLKSVRSSKLRGKAYHYMLSLYINQ